MPSSSSRQKSKKEEKNEERKDDFDLTAGMLATVSSVSSSLFDSSITSGIYTGKTNVFSTGMISPSGYPYNSWHVPVVGSTAVVPRELSPSTSIPSCPLILPSNIVGLTMHGEIGDSPLVTCSLPPLSHRYTPREDVFREKTSKRGAKGSLKPCNVKLFDVYDYKGLYVDPGTSSMATRVTRRRGGKTKKVKHWETKDFRVDSTLIRSVQEYIDGLLDKYNPDVVVVEIQLSKFGLEYTQHIVIGAAIARGIPVITLQPATRYRAFGLKTRDKNNGKLIYEIALDILEEEGDIEGLTTISTVKGITCKNGTKVSAQKRREDLLTTVTLELCAENLITQAAMEIRGN